MEFLLYLTPAGQEIISKIMLKNYNVRENAPICRNKQLFGVLKSPDFVVCLNNIKNTISPVKHYVNETVYHEAVHVAQACSYAVYETEAYYLEDKPEEVLYHLKKYCF